MKWLRILTIILIVLIIVSITVSIVLANIYSSNNGSIEGTGFIIQEYNGAGGISFDVDDNGNIYFAIDISNGRGITVYDNKGNYKYTLPVYSSGGIRVKIDEDNNILVYFIRGNSITEYNNKGIEMATINDKDYSLLDEFPDFPDQNVRERNGIHYINNHGTITKEENGVKTVVFTVPVWQRWYRAFKLILILSCVAMFIRVFISLSIKAHRDRNERKAKKKLQSIQNN